jgi:gamma-glutamylcysteine synthetase
MHDAMIGHILRGSKPREEWRTGLELEVIGYKVGASLERLDYASVRKVLEDLFSSPSLSDSCRTSGFEISD